ARLNGPTAAWIPDASDGSPWLQVDLGRQYMICAVGTQGHPSGGQWTTAYRLTTSLDNKIWENIENSKELPGNTDRNTVVVHWFKQIIAARFVKIKPLSWNNAICMRAQIYGCELGKVAEEERGVSHVACALK
ncbi:predicted protein, partial [Nematostella vectensis]